MTLQAEGVLNTCPAPRAAQTLLRAGSGCSQPDLPMGEDKAMLFIPERGSGYPFKEKIFPGQEPVGWNILEAQEGPGTQQGDDRF